MTIHKYEDVELVRLDYSTFHLYQASKHRLFSFDKSEYSEYIVKAKPLISLLSTILSYRNLEDI